MRRLEEVRPTMLQIDLDNLAYNMKNLRAYIGDETLIMAVVKTNAYGHGAVIPSKVFLENGADRLGVSIMAEGIELRKAGIGVPILILNYTPPSQYEKILEYDLTQNIYDYKDAKALSDTALRMKKEAIIHIKIDTGMGRLGFFPNDKAVEEIIRISKLPNIRIEGIFTHFARSDELDKTFTDLQFKRFMDMVEKIEDRGLSIRIKHASNSAAVIDMKKYSLDMVRPGILLYGHYPSKEVNKGNLKIKPAMTLKSKISKIKTAERDIGIGYNHFYKTDKKSKIGTLPIGYGDGYSRMLTGKASVGIKGTRARIVGNICMDQMMVDVTDIDHVRVGDEVVLFGHEGNSPSVEEVGAWLGTINYEVLCMMARRLPRIYTRDKEISHIVDYLLN